MVVMETAGLDATELGGYCRQRGLFPQQVDLEKRHQPAGPARDQAAAAGPAPQGQGPGGGGCHAERLKKDPGLEGEDEGD